MHLQPVFYLRRGWLAQKCSYSIFFTEVQKHGLFCLNISRTSVEELQFMSVDTPSLSYATHAPTRSLANQHFDQPPSVSLTRDSGILISTYYTGTGALVWCWIPVCESLSK